MSVALVLCVLPSERVGLCAAVVAAGAVPVVDLTAGPRVEVPAGAWVRARHRRNLPGVGPVLLAGGGHAGPVRGRETWLEVTEPDAGVPEGFAGVVLRGAEAGGPCGAEPGLALLAGAPAGLRVLLDAGLGPEGVGAAVAAGAEGVVVSDALLACPELGLGPRLRARLADDEPARSRVVNGIRVHVGALAPVLRRLLDGAPFWELAQGWFSADDPAEHAIPWGLGALQAGALAAAHGGLAGVVGAFVAAAAAAGPVALRAAARPARAAASAGDAVAIVGLGCRLPGASSVAELWEGLLAGRSAIGEVPKERWDPALFWDADKSATDRTYAKIGGFLTGFRFEPRRFRIPPGVARLVDPVQQIALEAVADALVDAGYPALPGDAGRPFDRARTAVILGNSMGGELTDDYTVRVRIPAFQAALSSVPGFQALGAEAQRSILAGFEAALRAELPPITEDSMPGELSNVIAGRVANALDLSGANFTVDAACASSMAAVQTAVKGLLDGDFDMAITGGADRSMGAATYVKFCKIGALSPDHSAPFDASANGFVMGEGCGVLVLKRLSDAERDGDRVYAVIRGIGASSDGKGKGITAPNPAGQRLALRRAYAQAGFGPETVDLVECHGTSTVVGDKVEVEALSEVIGAGRRATPIRIGSIKSNIGHLKSAAGAASLVKAALAVHHGVFPPSVGYRTARPDVPLGVVPLQVQTVAEPWAAAGPRRAGVSAFGFGGTNFHVVLEEHRPGAAPAAVAAPAVAALPAVAPRVVVADPVPEGLWAVSAGSREELVARLERGDTGGAFEAAAPVRVCAAAESGEERAEQVDRLLKVLRSDQSPELLRSRGIALEEEPCNGKLAFLFTGQGSQYIGMGLDLAAAYPIVAATFAEADAVLHDELGGPLTRFIRRDPSMPEEEQFERLRATEISQPATLAIDIALLRLLASFGVRPDVVAGHSLGEYAAAVAAGMLSFEHALLAVSARGREMASVRLDDPGKMAGIATSHERVQEVLAEIPGYVVAANKNCATQTVIAGESDAVEAAIEAFRSRGVTVYPLPVSHAFHSRIVAPASAPLRKVLERLDLRAPVRPITTNVTGRYYPMDPGSREFLLDNLAAQVAAPVEWIDQVERMYADGARIFVECGPKRALAGFVASILKRRPHRALYTNNPKRGGPQSFLDALAGLVALGFPVSERPAGTADLFAPSAPRRASSAAMAAWVPASGAAPAPAAPGAGVASEGVWTQVVGVVAELTGYRPDELAADDHLEADLGVDTVKQAELVARVRDRFRLDHDPDFRLADHKTLGDLADYAARRLGATRASRPRPAAVVPAAVVPAAVAVPVAPAAPAAPAPGSRAALPADALAALAEGAVRAGLAAPAAGELARAILPAVQGLVAALVAALPAPAPAASAPALPAPVAPRPAPASALPAASPGAAVSIVASGASVGLPGGEEVFAPDNARRILRGENRISRLSPAAQARFFTKNITRLEKDPQTGEGRFSRVDTPEDVIRLAGRRAAFDLVAQYGVDPEWARALDLTTQLAFAAGLEALRDAGLPLVRRFKQSAGGKAVPAGWGLPPSVGDRMGIVFASAFPGYIRFAEHLARGGDDGEGRFDRRFLFQILAMGHSQLAQLLGARGPNTQVNAACASTTQAIAIAEDWIRTGRADRVLVVGADDVTDDALLEWIGAGFLASGAATTKDEVAEAALPFDRRRHGMILGMGAVGVVLERAELVAARGVAPLARLLGTRISNSAFHGTRLDAAHIAAEVDALVGAAAEAAGVGRADFARQAVFLSHETYTPARGGSAAAEIAALRAAFGPAAREIVVANTKGFTGHAMGAGIEDAVVLKALQYEEVPPVPNLREPDPDLGDLTLSAGGPRALRFGLRLAAGFGSQLALAAWEKVARGDARVVDAARHAGWLREIGGGEGALVVEDRQLRLVVERGAAAPAVAPAPAAAAPAPAPAAPAAPANGPARSREEVVAALLDVVAARTGYGVAELDLSYELEADLGVDTVKQAEILGELRARFGLERDDNFRLSDHRTLGALADALAAWGGAAPAAVAPAAVAPAAVAPAAVAPAAGRSREDVVNALLDVVSRRTGYRTDELDLGYELEADLGVDTVKQAEILGELRERFGLERDDNFRLSDHRTLGALADALAAWGGGASAASAPVAPAPVAPAPVAPAPSAPAPVSPAPAAPPAGRDLASVQAALLEVIAARTGYRTDELDLGFELEADLGVDTVKQAEIVGELRERFSLPRDDGFRLSDHRSIGDLAAALAAWSAGGAPTAPAPVAPAPVAPADPPPVPAPQLAVDAPEPPSFAPSAPPPPALTPRGLTPGVRVRRPVIVPRPVPPATRRLDGRCLHVLGEGPFAVALRLEALNRGATLEGVPDAVIDAAAEVDEAFRFARALGAARPRDWLCATRLGADPSWVDPEAGLVNGARAGFAKAIGREWEGCAARVVDVDPLVDDTIAAEILLDELAGPDGSVEIFHDGDQRKVLALEVDELPPEDGRLQDNAVIVLTGGTRGVTARVARELARRGRVRLALLARTAPAEAPLDEEREKARIRAELEARGERASPARVDAALAPLRTAEEARQTVEDLRALGAEVAVFAVDMGDEDAVREALAAVRARFGYIDGVIHGAGIEKSRLIAEKDEAEFHRIYDPKARGGIALARNLERVAWFVSMGSVAGRFGNAGQVDYAAANEAMARVCLSRPRSLHVDWTAWGDTGMATRGGMEHLLTSKGVELLPAEGGARLLVDLIAAGVTGEVVVAGRLGAFPLPAAHPLLDAVEFDGDAAIGRRRLHLRSDPWLADHAIAGVPVLPGVIGLELMAAVARFVRPALPVAGFADVRFDAPVKVHGDEPTHLVVRAEPDGPDRVRCTVSSERAGRAGRTLRAEHFAATVLLGDASASEALPPLFWSDEPLERAEVYRRFFHGPRFQVLDAVECVAENGLYASARVDHAPFGTPLVGAPLVLEAAFQAAGLHHMAVAGRLGLPAAVGAVHLLGEPDDRLHYELLVQQAGDAWDIDVDGPGGPILRVRGYRMADAGPLPPGERFPVPEGGWPLAMVARVTKAGSPGGAPMMALDPAEEALIAARGTARRQADRRLGRAAARAALVELLGHGDFAVLAAPSGAPTVCGAPATVSICHSDGVGFAAAARDGHLGLDAERPALRSPSFAATWFTAAERAWSAGHPIAEAQIWTAKEAVMKALGLGMRLHPREIEVASVVGHRVSVVLHGEAAAAWAALGGGALRVSTGWSDGFVVAAARIAAAPVREAAPARRRAG